MVGVAGDAGRIGRLLDEMDDAAALVHVHHAESGGVGAQHLDASDRHVGAGVDMLCQHDSVVHLVDVVAGQDDDVAHPVAFDDVDVLGDGIGGAEIPVSFIDPLGGGQHVEHLVAFGPKEDPATLQMSDQAVGLVLGRHADAANAGIDRVGQREIDDPALAAEEDCRFRPPVRQLFQPTAPPPRRGRKPSSGGSASLYPLTLRSFLPPLVSELAGGGHAATVSVSDRRSTNPPSSLPDCTRTARGSDVPAERNSRRRHWFNLIIADLMMLANKKSM